MSYPLTEAAVDAADIRPSAQKLVFLVLTRHARNDGTGAEPSVETITTKAGVSERSAQYHLRDLERDDWIAVEREAYRGEDGKYHARSYRINVPKLMAALKVFEDRRNRGAAHCTPETAGVQPTGVRGATERSSGVQPIAPESVLKNRSEESVRGRAPADAGLPLTTAASDSGRNGHVKPTATTVSDFLDAYARLYEANVGKAPLNGKGAARLVEPVLQQCGSDLAYKMLTRFFESEDPFYLQAGYSLNAFVACAPQLLVQVNVLGLR